MGFRRQKANWNRPSSSFVDVIDVQVSKAGDALTVNAGVMDSEVYKQCWGSDPPPLIDEASCTVRARIGHLTNGDKDLWWPIVDANTPQAVVELVAETVLPFLERMHSRKAMMEFLSTADVLRRKYPPPIIYLAIIKSDLGDKLGACSLLDDLRESVVGAWLTRISEISTRIGCP